MAEVGIAHLVRVRFGAAEAVAPSPGGIHDYVVDSGSEQVVTTGIAQPPGPRNVTARVEGQAGSVRPVQVTIAGTDAAGAPIEEALPPFTRNTPGAVEGELAFATVTSITIPAHDGTDVSTAIGWGSRLGLPERMEGAVPLVATVGGRRPVELVRCVPDDQELSRCVIEVAEPLVGHSIAVALVL